jgi:ADP-heptose:LPS heptosyltransferase
LILNTLVYHYGALGDFITILPLLEQWKKTTRSKVVLLGKPEFGVLAEHSGYVDETWDAESRMNLYLLTSSESELFVKKLSEFEVIMLFAHQDSPIFINCKMWFTGKLLAQPPFPSDRVPIVDYHMQLIKDYMSVYLTNCVPKIKVGQRCTTVPFNTIAIHPGSGSRKKNWRFSNYLHVAEVFRSKGYPILWIIGPAENLNIPEEDIVCTGVTLAHVAGILYQSSFYIGNDSGISHLAAAVGGPPVLVIFGPSDPVVWSPRGENHVEIVYKESACAPCHNFCAANNFECAQECLDQISAEEIVLRVEAVKRSRENSLRGFKY